MNVFVEHVPSRPKRTSADMMSFVDTLQDDQMDEQYFDFFGSCRQMPIVIADDLESSSATHQYFLDSEDEQYLGHSTEMSQSAPKQFEASPIIHPEPAPYDYDNMPLADQPEGLAVELADYQRQGLQWMMDRPNGCILADEMGLGKTVQVIALMHASPVHLTLVAAPVALLDQWVDEIRSKSKPNTMMVLKYHGPKRSQIMSYLKNILQSGTRIKIVVVTSHALLGSESSRIELQATRENPARVAYDFAKNPLMQFFWSRVVIDEAHLLRSTKSQAHHAACGLSYGGIVLLTGTPLTNKHDDFRALLAIMDHEYKDKALWKRDILNKLPSAEGVARLRVLKDNVMLRRVKGQIICGKPITELPVCEHVSIELSFEEGSAEEVFYDAIVSDVAAVFSTIDSVAAEKKQSIMLTLLLRLRQAACHPFILGMASLAEYYAPQPLPRLSRLNWNLVRDACQRIINEYSAQESPTTTKEVLGPNAVKLPPILTLENASSKLNRALQIVQHILHDSKDDRVIIFSQFVSFLNVCQHTLEKQLPNVNVLRIDGRTSQQNRRAALDQFKNLTSHRVLLLSLNAAGVGLDLSAANHVILLDSWWNSAVELQAQDRINRIGQVKPTKIYRFMMKGTVEERVEQIKAKKDILINSAFGLDNSTQAKSPLLTTYNLTAQDIEAMIVPINRKSRQTPIVKKDVAQKH